MSVLNLSESIAKETVYIKYTKPQPTKAKVNETSIVSRKNGISEQKLTPVVVAIYAVRLLPIISDNIASGYCITTVPNAPAIGNKYASSSMAEGIRFTTTGSKLINDKSINPTKIQPAAIVGPVLIKKNGDC